MKTPFRFLVLAAFVAFLLAPAILRAEDDPVDCEALGQAVQQSETSLRSLESSYTHACTEDPTTTECTMMKLSIDIAREAFNKSKAELRKLGCTIPEP